MFARILRNRNSDSEDECPPDRECKYPQTIVECESCTAPCTPHDRSQAGWCKAIWDHRREVWTCSRCYRDWD